MKKLFLFGPALGLFALLAGCNVSGLGSGSSNSSVTGRVLDVNSQPVRDARVYADGKEAITSSTGAFFLENVTDGPLEIRAEVSQDGTNYRGQTWVLNFDGEQTQNANIIVGPVGQLGSVRGTVRDRDGFLLEGVPVFAYNGAGSSARAFTNADGEWEINDLIDGYIYEVHAMAQGYRSDTDTLEIQAGTTRNANLVLGTPGSPTLSAPTNLTAITWTSEPDARSVNENGLPWAKAHYSKDGKVKKTIGKSRATSDLIVEVELEWDEQRFADHLGWGIYRASSAGGALNGLDFFGDPLSAYYFDATVIPNRTYSYAVSTLSSQYPEFPNFTESNLSNRAVAETLDVLRLNAPTLSPVTIRWQGGSGADQYIVYIFDTLPKVGVSPIWDNESSPATGNSVVPGMSYTSGRTYYYLVLGIANGVDSRTISKIGSFVP